MKQENEAFGFRLFVDDETSPQFFSVLVHPNKAALNSHRWEGKKRGRECEAYWSPNHNHLEMKCRCGRSHFRKCAEVGTIHLHQGCLCYGIFAHEIFHAVMTWAVFNGANPAINEACLPDSNEICAGLMGRLLATMIQQLKGFKIKNQ